MLEHALEYAAMGWHVLPCHSVVENINGLMCTCEDIGCNSPGKHPCTPNGLTNATTNPEWINAWWKKWPWANVAILTGAPSGFIALDIDPKNGGDISLDDLTDKYGALPHTVIAITGSGGQHYLFQHPGFQIKNTSNKIAPGVDIKGDRGYIIATPSQHISGNCYEWEASSEPGMIPIAPIPQFLLTLIQDADTKKNTNKFNQTIQTGQPISEGGRNTYLLSCAGTMVRRDMSPQAVNAAIHAENNYRCQPPLDTREVSTILTSAERYRKL